MITINTNDDGKIVLKVEKNTSGTELLAGIEMLIEVAMEEINMSINQIVDDIMRIYERDNK